ncbi:MAG TPA: glutaredoxin family protein [Gammaproteobacteria bacterium]|nr:glutaredoxin family protein [Gammaproteobacteria bacterium]
MSRPLTLYYRDGCHLCEQMLAELRALYGKDCPLTLVDVDSEAQLRARYGLQVPVLMGGERMLGSGRLDHAGLEEYLAGK